MADAPGGWEGLLLHLSSEVAGLAGAAVQHLVLGLGATRMVCIGCRSAHMRREQLQRFTIALS